MGLLRGPNDQIGRPVQQDVVRRAPLEEVEVQDRPPEISKELGEAHRLARRAREDDHSLASAGLDWRGGARVRGGDEPWALEGDERMERGRRAGRVAQSILPATIEHLESAPLQVVFGPSGRIDGQDALAVRVHLPVRAAAAVVTEGAGGAPFELAAPGAAAVGGTPRPIRF